MTSEQGLRVIEVINRLRANATRLHKQAQTLAWALELTAPLPGRRWLALCCTCAEQATSGETDEECHAMRLSLGGECSRCPVVGYDVIVVSVQAGGEE